MGSGAFGFVVSVIVGAAAAAVLSACSSPSPGSGSTVVTGSGLAISCSTNDDCVGVYFGDVCGFCDLPNAAIASSAETEYQNAANAAQSRCPPARIGGTCANIQTITTCAMGMCMLTTCPAAASGAHACASTNDASVSGSDAGTNDAG